MNRTSFFVSIAALAATLSSPEVIAGTRIVVNFGSHPSAAVASKNEEQVAYLWEIATDGGKASHRIWALRGFARVVPQLARDNPDEVAKRLQAAMEVAEREEEKRLILSRLPAVRATDALTLALACLEDEALRSEAIEVTADLGEAMQDSHPQVRR